MMRMTERRCLQFKVTVLDQPQTKLSGPCSGPAASWEENPASLQETLEPEARHQESQSRGFHSQDNVQSRQSHGLKADWWLQGLGKGHGE